MNRKWITLAKKIDTNSRNRYKELGSSNDIAPDGVELEKQQEEGRFGVDRSLLPTHAPTNKYKV
jgi:hypothetical protein